MYIAAQSRQFGAKKGAEREGTDSRDWINYENEYMPGSERRVAYKNISNYARHIEAKKSSPAWSGAVVGRPTAVREPKDPDCEAGTQTRSGSHLAVPAPAPLAPGGKEL